MSTQFTEVQKFNKWWFKLILLGLALIPAYGIYKQLYLKEIFGNKPMSDTGLIVFSIFILGLIVFMASMKLKTTINKDTIKLIFFPFTQKEVKWSDVKSAKVIDYGFVGGWGLKPGTKYGTVYNMSGSKGLYVELHHGKSFLIGTQKEEALQLFIGKLR